MDNIDLIFKALSDPIRLDILKKLYSAESVCVCELTDIPFQRCRSRDPCGKAQRVYRSTLI